MRRIKNLLKKGTSLMLVMAMLMGLCSTGFAVNYNDEHAGESGKIYVSLGDSMANGFGLDGYDYDLNGDGKLDSVNGVLTHAQASYPCIFADTYGFDHIPLAMSAMRAEDLHFILEFPYWNDEYVGAIREMEHWNSDTWNEDQWNSLFTYGDYYTWNEFVRSRFLEDYANIDNNMVGTEKYAQLYQESIASADVISLGTGNSNFGVFLLHYVLDVLAPGIASDQNAGWVDLDRPLTELDDETRAFVENLIGELRGMLDAELSSDETIEEVLDATTYAVVSYIINYKGVIDRIVELKDGEDVEIMIVGLMNTLYGMEVINTPFGTLYIGDYLGAVISAMNAYLAGLPAVMKATGEYENAAFYYAEASNVNLIYTTMWEYAGDDYTFDGYPTVRDRLAKEIVNGLPFQLLNVSANPDTITNFENFVITEKNLSDGSLVVPTQEEITNYFMYRIFEIATVEATKDDTLDLSALMQLTGGLGNLNAAMFEDVVTKATEKGTALAAELPAHVFDAVSTYAQLMTAVEFLVDAMLGEVNKNGELVEGSYGYVYALAYELVALLVMAESDLEVEVAGDKYDAALAEIAETIVGALEAELATIAANFGITEVTADKAETLLEEAFADIDSEFVLGLAKRALSELDTDALKEKAKEQPEYEAALEIGIDEAVAFVEYYVALETFKAAFAPVAEALLEEGTQATVGTQDDLDKTLEDANEGIHGTITAYAKEIAGDMVDDEILGSLLHLFGRMMVGNGLGCHPTEAGHRTLADAVLKAYEGKVTADKALYEKVVSTLKYLIDNYADDAYAYGYNYALENGYINAAVEALEIADAELYNIEALLMSGEMSAEFRAELAVEFVNAHETIAQLSALIQNATELNQDSINEAWALLVQLQKHVDSIVKLAQIAGADVSGAAYEQLLVVNALILDTITKYEDAIREIHDSAVTCLYNKVRECYDELVEAVKDAYAEYGPEVVAYVTNFLTENYAEIITLVYENTGVDAEAVFAYIFENRETIAAYIVKFGAPLAPYGEDMLIAVLEIAAEYGLKVAEQVNEYLYNHATEINAIIEEIVTECGEKYVAVVYDLLVEVITEFGPKAAESLHEFLVDNAKDIAELVYDIAVTVNDEYADEIMAILTNAAVKFGPKAVTDLVVYMAGHTDEIVEIITGLSTEAHDEYIVKLFNMMVEIATTYGVDALNSVCEMLLEDGDQLYTIVTDLATTLNDEYAERIMDLVMEACAVYGPKLATDLITYLTEEVDMIEIDLSGLDTALIEKVAPIALDAAKFIAFEYGPEIATWVFEYMMNDPDATSAEYVLNEDSYYVAIGDSSVLDSYYINGRDVAEYDSYADLLAAELGLTDSYTNLGADAATIADAIAQIVANAEIVAGADLITVGYSSNTFVEFMFAQMYAVINGGDVADMDWSAVVGTEAAGYVELALTKLYEELVAQGLDQDIPSVGNAADLLMTAVESYAYAYAGYAVAYPQLLATIRSINPEAVVVSVGMSNTLDTLALDLTDMGVGVIAIGEYVQYLVYATNCYNLALAVQNDGVIYVDAPAVETILVEKELDYSALAAFIANVVSTASKNVFYANAAGHEYIKDQILNALTIVDETPDYIMGDVNGDGVVNTADVIMMLKAIAAKTVDELSAAAFAAADVTRDGEVNTADAVKILKAIAAKTTDEL